VRRRKPQAAPAPTLMARRLEGSNRNEEPTEQPVVRRRRRRRRPSFYPAKQPFLVVVRRGHHRHSDPLARRRGWAKAMPPLGQYFSRPLKTQDEWIAAPKGHGPRTPASFFPANHGFQGIAGRAMIALLDPSQPLPCSWARPCPRWGSTCRCLGRRVYMAAPKGRQSWTLAVLPCKSDISWGHESAP
jgi:hypothetical protein